MAGESWTLTCFFSSAGVVYSSPRLQPLNVLSKYLHTTPSAIRRLNPDIGADDEMIGEMLLRVCTRTHAHVRGCPCEWVPVTARVGACAHAHAHMRECPCE
jgi:hypothetical protein